MLHLVDISLPMVEAWRRAFARAEGVEVHHADLLQVASDTIVSPANSYGDMGGGIYLVYRRAFGWGLERAVQGEIAKHPKGYLPVGEALVVPLKDSKPIYHMIVAPTMFVPGPAKVEDVHLAMMAMLEAWANRRADIEHVFCPGFGTGVGSLSVDAAATAMADAYRQVTATGT